jgi:hypothetical protein
MVRRSSVARSKSDTRGRSNDVRFGSKADIGLAAANVRFTPESGVTALRFEDFLDRPVGIVWRDRRVPLVVAALLAGNMKTPLDVAHLEHLIPKNRAATSGQGVAPPSGARQATAGRAASRPDRPSRAFSDYYVNYTTFHGL